MTVIPLKNYTVVIDRKGARYLRHEEAGTEIPVSPNTATSELIDKILELQQ